MVEKIKMAGKKKKKITEKIGFFFKKRDKSDNLKKNSWEKKLEKCSTKK